MRHNFTAEEIALFKREHNKFMQGFKSKKDAYLSDFYEAQRKAQMRNFIAAKRQRAQAEASEAESYLHRQDLVRKWNDFDRQRELAN
jgi:hypothetical protein